MLIIETFILSAAGRMVGAGVWLGGMRQEPDCMSRHVCMPWFRFLLM